MFVVSISLFTSCLTYKEVEVIGVEGVSVKQFSTKGVAIDVAIKLDNPNAYKIKLIRSDLGIYIRGKQAGKAKIENKVVLKKHSQDTHHITVSANYKEITAAMGSGLLSLLMNSSVPLEIKGQITARAMMISKSFPVDVKQNVKL